MKRSSFAFAILASISNIAESVGVVRFEFLHGSGKDAPKYFAETPDQKVISVVRNELSKPLDSRKLHISGLIERTSAEDNPPWHWRFVPNQWSLVEISTEVCDGQPKYVEDNLDDWLLKVKRYCPYHSTVLRELVQP